MSNKERKLFLTGLILVFSFMISGYTIRNADYMVIYEKYSQEFEQYRKELKYEENKDDIDYIKKSIEQAKLNFEEEIKSNYSSDITDRILLNISWKKFNKSYNKVKVDIDNKLGIEEENDDDLVSLNSLEKKSENKEKQIIVIEKEEESIIEDEKEYVNVYTKEKIENKNNILLIVNNSELGKKLVFKKEKSKKESIIDIDFKDVSYIRSELENLKSESKENIFYSQNYNKKIEIKDETFIFNNGKWDVFSQGEEVYKASKLIFQLKGDIPGYGKTVYWNGSQMLTGVWVQEKDSDKTMFYDNIGNIIDLSVKGLWINISKDEEIKI